MSFPGGMNKSNTILTTNKVNFVSGTTLGNVYTLTRLLGSTSTFSLLGTSSNNLTVSGVTINATYAVGSSTQIAMVHEAVNGGTTSEKAITYPVAIVGPLGLSATSFDTSAITGTVIGNFTALAPNEYVLTITPNDNRVSIADSGSTLRIGSVISQSGTISYTFTTNLGRTLIQGITATSVKGLTPTTFTQTPSAQYHINSANITTTPPLSFTATINGNVMNITTNNGPSLIAGDVVTIPGNGTATVLKQGNGSIGDWAGATGNFIIDGTRGNLGSVTCSFDPKIVLSIADATGNNVLNATATTGPRLMTDASGRKFIRFFDWSQSRLQGATGLSITSQQSTWIAVGRFFIDYDTSKFKTIADISGNNGESPILATSGTKIACQGFGADSFGSNGNKMIVGCQMSVIGSASTRTGGYATYIMNNEQSTAATHLYGGGNYTASGITIGSNGAGSNNWGKMDLYELSVFAGTQMGDISQVQTNGSAASQTAMTNFGVVPVTKHLVIMGHSQMAASSTILSDVAAVLTEPGNSFSVDNSTRVFQHAISGGGLLDAWGIIADNYSLANTTMMLAGGAANNKILFVAGDNDWTVKWPSTDNGGRYAHGTDAFIQDMFNGAPYTASVNGVTIDSGDPRNATATSITSGTLYKGAKLTFAGHPEFDVGLTVGTDPNGLSFSLTGGEGTSNGNTAGVTTPVDGTASLKSYIAFVETMLNRNFGVRWTSQIGISGGNRATPASGDYGAQFRKHILYDAVSQVTTDSNATLAANLKVNDLTAVTVAGAEVYGGSFDHSVTAPYTVDGIHFNPAGVRVAVSGGDTPANGLSALVKS